MHSRIPGINRPVHYPSSDGKPMAESDLHIDILTVIRERLKAWAAEREDVYVAGNMLVYYVEGEPRRSLAPDCFVVFGVENRSRLSFKTWKEKAVPSVVFEFTSKSTQKEDLEKKFEIYRDIWKVEEYFLFDPQAEYLEPNLQGFRLVDGQYVSMSLRNGHLESRRLGITIEVDGPMLILKDSATGLPLLTRVEKERDEHRERALRESLRAEKSEAIAETARDRAEAERVRAEAAQAEVERLRAELAALKDGKK